MNKSVQKQADQNRETRKSLGWAKNLGSAGYDRKSKTGNYYNGAKKND